MINIRTTWITLQIYVKAELHVRNPDVKKPYSMTLLACVEYIGGGTTVS